MRLLIADIHEHPEGIRISKLSLTRVPIRLGASVFETGSISNARIKKLCKTMKAFRYLLEVYEVKAYRTCATSAMREAQNKDEVLQKVKEYAGVSIEVIDGKVEADLIFSTFITQRLDPAGTYLYIDVGGGSTEVTLLREGKRLQARSFRIGTVRLLKGRVEENEWENLRTFVTAVTPRDVEVTAIGTGGNVNRIFKLNKLRYGDKLSLGMLRETYKMLGQLNVQERIDQLRLRPDRADVILPAARIYLTALKAGNVHEMMVPKIGLSDGIALYLYNAYKEKMNVR